MIKAKTGRDDTRTYTLKHTQRVVELRGALCFAYRPTEPESGLIKSHYASLAPQSINSTEYPSFSAEHLHAEKGNLLGLYAGD